MFTGIITNVAKVLDEQQTHAGKTISIECPKTWKNLAPGESIAVDGICLTIEQVDEKKCTLTLVPETLDRTTFGSNRPQKVNLERSLVVGDRFGGHFVTGHVDGLGQVERVEVNGEYRIWISIPKDRQDLLVDKGSVTVNGVALTIAGLGKGQFSAVLIPYTLKNTTLSNLRKGDAVNLEFDMMLKQVKQHLTGKNKE